MKETFDSFKSKIEDIASPFIASIMISWIILNHKYLLIYFGTDKLSDKLNKLNAYNFSASSIPDAYNIIFPILFGLFYVYIYPWFANLFYIKAMKNKSVKENIKNDIYIKSLKEEKQELYEKIIEKDNKINEQREKLINIATALKKEFEKDKEDLQTTYSNHEQEIKARQQLEIENINKRHNEEMDGINRRNEEEIERRINEIQKYQLENKKSEENQNKMERRIKAMNEMEMGRMKAMEMERMKSIESMHQLEMEMERMSAVGRLTEMEMERMNQIKFKIERMKQHEMEKMNVMEQGRMKKYEMEKMMQNEIKKRQKQRTLNEHFDTMTSLKQRDKSIKEAVQDGYKQSEIAEFLQLSRTTISKIMAKLSK